MVKIFFLPACLIIIALSDLSLSINIDCEFVLNDYIVFGSTYYCNVWTVPEITTPAAAQITSAKGIHKDKRTNDDVIGIHARRKTMKYFPQNLLSVFKNLKRIHINGCKLEEIHQSDLKAHPNLTHFYLTENLIEVVEEGLFDFNPNLVWVGINEAKLVHIDAHVFDHLTGLKSFWFTQVTCVKKTIENSREKVEAAIYIVKAYCVNAEFTALDGKLDKLEDDSKSLSAEDFRASLENFEKSFIFSKFSKFRPLNLKFEKLKGKSGGTSTTTPKTPEQEPNKPPENTQTCQNLEGQLTTSLTNITSRLDTLTSSQESAIQSIIKLSTKFNDHKSKSELSADDIKSTMSDMDTALSSIKASQNDLKTALNKLKNFQNEIAVSINELKSSKSNDFEEKFVAFGKDIGSLKEQMKSFMSNFTFFEVENAEKFHKMENEFANTRHKMEVNLDEKIKGIEKRIVKKFEEILEEKLGKILKNL